MSLKNWLRRTFDIWDLLCMTALGLIGWGLWGFDPRLALIVVGGYVLLIATLGAIRRGDTGTGG